MKNLSLFYLIVAFVLLLGCSEDSPISPRSTDSGNLSIKFDKTAVPDEVVSVIATLTRSNFTPVVGQLNLQSSTSAELLIEELAVGNWHLLVEALDQNNTVLYSGETEIEILANTITPVQLTLNPVSSGMGSIHITVTWGTLPNPSGWTDYENNPILTKQGNSHAPYGVALSYVLKEEESYKMWFGSLGSGGMAYIFHAISLDGLSWNSFSQPVLNPGPIGNWDSGRAGSGPVIKEGNSYRLYYHSYEEVQGVHSIGLAYSSDGLTWEKHNDPVLSGIAGTWEQRIAAHHIEKINNQYYMYYTGSLAPKDHKIGLAISDDGLTWQRYEGNPILEPTEYWEGSGVAYPSIIMDDGEYQMVYTSQQSNGQQNAFGIAKSTDGINWTKLNDNPIFTTENCINNYSQIGYPNFQKFDDRYVIYYTGYSATTNDLEISATIKNF